MAQANKARNTNHRQAKQSNPLTLPPRTIDHKNNLPGYAKDYINQVLDRVKKLISLISLIYFSRGQFNAIATHNHRKSSTTALCCPSRRLLRTDAA
jgi:hypothetical protein